MKTIYWRILAPAVQRGDGTIHRTINIVIHSKYFPRFWLAKSTRIIHHNQLLMTKFGRILCLTRKWHQKCSLLQVNAPLTKKTWGWDWVVFVVKTKMADTSLVSRVRTTAGTRQNNAKKDSENSKKPTRRATCHLLFGEYLRSWTNLNVNYQRKT